MSSLPWSLAEVGVVGAGDLQECLLTREERVCQSSGCPVGVHLVLATRSGKAKDVWDLSPTS